MAFTSLITVVSRASLMCIGSARSLTKRDIKDDFDAKWALHMRWYHDRKLVFDDACTKIPEWSAFWQGVRQRAAAIYMTIDAYAYFVLHQQHLIADSDVAGVFAYPADDVCDTIPVITPETDRLCRKVARYYYALFTHLVVDWNGKPVRWRHKIANTKSYRAGASYQQVERDLRHQIKPYQRNAEVLQFDWRAAEWTLILQHVGYQPGEDAYAAFTACGLDRDAVKAIVLPRVYGARLETLYEKNAPALVDAVVQQMETQYPEVLAWSERMRNTSVIDFQGFLIDLGAESYKRPNRWAQTALQLCKWDLIGRLVDRNLQSHAAGDLHDQLFFDFVAGDPVSRSEALAIIAEIQKPCFGKYHLPAKLARGLHWQ